jgi:hypothetical protein
LQLEWPMRAQADRRGVKEEDGVSASVWKSSDAFIGYPTFNESGESVEESFKKRFILFHRAGFTRIACARITSKEREFTTISGKHRETLRGIIISGGLLEVWKFITWKKDLR